MQCFSVTETFDSQCGGGSLKTCGDAKIESRKHVDGFRIAKNVDSMHLVQNSKYPTTVTQKLLSSRISVHFAQIKVKKTLTLIDLHLNSATRDNVASWPPFGEYPSHRS